MVETELMRRDVRSVIHRIRYAATRQMVLMLLPCLTVFGQASAQVADPEKLYDYYPPIEPFRTGHLKVDDTHEIYYELSGNPLGHPVMVLHGGPGGGSYPTLRQYHDPKKYQIILFDQRGCGKSKPLHSLEGNSTPNLVEDMEKLRAELKIEKMQVVGGSWGSTLALAYAEKYPSRVDSLVLRGLFLGTKSEIDHFYHGGVGEYFPEVYARLQAVIPKPKELNYPRQLLGLLKSDDVETRKLAARAWSAYETKVGALLTTDEEVESILKQFDTYAFALIENHYMANGCFLEEGELLNNVSRLSGIPSVICHGRYDVICTPRAAYQLHKALTDSVLVIVEAAGHSGSAPLMRSAIIAAIRSLEPRVLGSKE